VLRSDAALRRVDHRGRRVLIERVSVRHQRALREIGMHRAFHAHGIAGPPGLVIVEDRRLDRGLGRRLFGLDHFVPHWSID
jgi:hypothetical protein